MDLKRLEIIDRERNVLVSYCWSTKVIGNEEGILYNLDSILLEERNWVLLIMIKDYIATTGDIKLES